MAFKVQGERVVVQDYVENLEHKAKLEDLANQVKVGKEGLRVQPAQVD